MLDTSLFSKIHITIGQHEDGTPVYFCQWLQGELDLIAMTEELWSEAYEFFIPPGQPLAVGNRVRIGPFEMEFEGHGRHKMLQFRLVFPQQKGKYKIGLKEDKWTKIT